MDNNETEVFDKEKFVKTELILQLFELNNMKSTLNMAVQMTYDQVLKEMEEVMDSDPSDLFKEKLMEFFQNTLGYDSPILSKYINLYLETYTQENLLNLIELNKDEKFREISEKQLKMAIKSFKIGQDIIAENSQKLEGLLKLWDINI